MERAGTILLRLALAAALLAGATLYFGLAASGVAEWQLALAWYVRKQFGDNVLFIPAALLAGSLSCAWLLLAFRARVQHRHRLASGSVPARRVDVISDEQLRRRVGEQLEGELRKAEPAVARVVDALLGLPVDLGASELILVPEEAGAEIFLRLGMERVAVGQLPRPIYERVLERAQLIVGLEEPTGEGLLELRSGNSVEILEVSIRQGANGREASFVVTRRAGYSRTLDELGLSPALKKRLDQALLAGRGLVMVVGEAAQGLCTTLYAMAHHLHEQRKEECRIAGVEPHVRLELPFMVQMEVGGARPAAILAQLLEDDYKAIVVRRVEDAETAKLVLQAAGERLMIVSMEAAGPADALARLARWVGGKELRATLHFVVGQRLMPRLCACRDEVGVAEEERRDLQRFGEVGDGDYYGPAGCASCQGTGYAEEQRALFWALDLDGELGAALEGEVSEANLQRAARRAGAGPVSAALELAQRGEVALLDVVRLLDGRW